MDARGRLLSMKEVQKSQEAIAKCDSSSSSSSSKTLFNEGNI